MGLGVFSMVNLPASEFEVQVFQCPLANRPSISTNSAVGVRYGGNIVTILGSTVKGNHELLVAGSTTVGGLEVQLNGGRVEVRAPSLYDSTLISSSWPSSVASMGYYQNLYVSVPEQNTSSLDTAICVAEHGSAMPALSNSAAIFHKSELQALQASCGDLGTAPAFESCSTPLPACASYAAHAAWR